LTIQNSSSNSNNQEKNKTAEIFQPF